MVSIKCRLTESIELKIGTGYSQYLFHHGLGFGTLYGELAEFVAKRDDLHIIAVGVFHDPCHILVNIGSIDHKEEIVVATLVDKKIVHDAPLGVAHHAV